MAIDLNQVMTLVRAANPNFERMEGWKQGSMFWRALGSDKRSSLRPLLQAITDYNGGDGDARERIIHELIVLPEHKKAGRYQAVVSYLENHDDIKGLLRIEKGKIRLQNNQYRVNAGLADYLANFGDEFRRRLDGLRATDTWIDAGAGEAVAMRDYLAGAQGRDHARCVAIGYQKPNSPELAQFEGSGKRTDFSYVSGKYFGAMTDQDLGVEAGTASLITDYNGVLLYTPTLSEDLGRMLDLLKPGGILFCDFHAEIYEGEKLIGPPLWLGRVAGVTCKHIKSYMNMHFQLIRQGGEVLVPPLKLVAEASNFESRPPLRKFNMCL